MLNVMPVCAALDTLTMKVAFRVPLLPSATETSPTDTTGAPPVWGVTEKSSIESPSSAPAALKSVQRMRNDAPGGIAIPPIALLTAALASVSAPTDPVVTGELKSNGSTSIQVPALNDVASRLYLEVETVGATSRSQPPLFARVADIDAGDRLIRAVREDRADRGNQAATLQTPESSLDAACPAKAVGVAGISAAGSRGVDRVRVGSCLDELPSSRKRTRRATRGKGVEVLNVRNVQSGQDDGPRLRPSRRRGRHHNQRASSRKRRESSKVHNDRP